MQSIEELKKMADEMLAEALVTAKASQQEVLDYYESIKDTLAEDEEAAFQSLIGYGNNEIAAGEAQLAATSLEELMAISVPEHPSEEEAYRAVLLLTARGKIG